MEDKDEERRRNVDGKEETKNRRWCGTVEYMAPEICKREGMPGPDSDVWALGVVLYEILAGGDLPFHSVVLPMFLLEWIHLLRSGRKQILHVIPAFGFVCNDVPECAPRSVSQSDSRERKRKEKPPSDADHTARQFYPSNGTTNVLRRHY